MLPKSHTVQALLAMATAMLWIVCCGDSCPPTRGDGSGLVMFGDTDFYREATTAERSFVGFLECRERRSGFAGSREHSVFLRSASELPVYSGGGTSEARLRRVCGCSVEILGKQEDVGWGPEIWPGTVWSSGASDGPAE